MAPEIYKLMEEVKNSSKKDKIKIEYNPEKADVYSLGILIGSCCCLEMLDIKDSKEQLAKKLSLI